VRYAIRLGSLIAHRWRAAIELRTGQAAAIADCDEVLMFDSEAGCKFLHRVAKRRLGMQTEGDADIAVTQTSQKRLLPTAYSRDLVAAFASEMSEAGDEETRPAVAWNGSEAAYCGPIADATTSALGKGPLPGRAASCPNICIDGPLQRSW
jgi:hypothetical protein